MEAEVVRVRFLQCAHCGFLFNEAFSGLDYQVDYDSSRGHSAAVMAYYESIVFLIAQKLELSTGLVVEVGCGNGEFTVMLAEVLKSTGVVGFEPKLDPKFVIQPNNTRFVNDYYGEAALADLGVPDAVICRHTLEHVDDVVNFFSTLVLGNPRYLVIEVPCSSFVLNNNFHYFTNEHCSYFDVDSLSILAAKFDYGIVYCKHIFNSENIIVFFQYLCETRLGLLEETRRQNHLTKSFTAWRYDILQKIDAGDTLWGVGGKGAMLLPLLGLDYTVFPEVIDLNPNLNSRFVGVTGNEVKNPEFLKNSQNRPNKIFVSNSEYRDETIKMLGSYGIPSTVLNLIED